MALTRAKGKVLSLAYASVSALPANAYDGQLAFVRGNSSDGVASGQMYVYNSNAWKAVTDVVATAASLPTDVWEGRVVLVVNPHASADKINPILYQYIGGQWRSEMAKVNTVATQAEVAALEVDGPGGIVFAAGAAAAGDGGHALYYHNGSAWTQVQPYTLSAVTAAALPAKGAATGQVVIAAGVAAAGDSAAIAYRWDGAAWQLLPQPVVSAATYAALPANGVVGQVAKTAGFAAAGDLLDTEYRWNGTAWAAQRGAYKLANMSELVGLPANPQEGSVAILEGFHTAGDGGGGTFHFNTSAIGIGGVTLTGGGTNYSVGDQFTVASGAATVVVTATDAGVITGVSLVSSSTTGSANIGTPQTASAPTVNAGGSGLTTDITAAAAAGTGTGLELDVDATDGVVTALVVVTPGTGYVVDEQLTVDSGNGDCIIKIDSVGGSGEVGGVSIVAGGTGYIDELAIGVAYLTPVTAAVVNAAGANYNVGDVLAVTGGNGGARLTVATITAAGGVATLTVTAWGSGYTSAAGVATTVSSSVAGSGATVTLSNNHDGGTIIDPTNAADLATWDASAQTTWFTAGSGNGVWVRVYSGAASVRFFGAQSGLTASQDKSIQAALNSVTDVYVPAGTYRVDVALSPRSGTRIAGSGLSAAIIAYGVSAFNIVAGRTDVEISGMQCELYATDGAPDPRTHTAIVSAGVSGNANYRIRLNKLYLQGWLTGVSLQYTWDSRIDGITTVICTNGVDYFGQSVNNTIVNSSIGAMSDSSGICLWLRSDGAIIGEGLMVTNCLLASGETGIKVPNGFLSLSITNCVIDLITEIGLDITDVRQFSMSNCWLYTGTLGIKWAPLGVLVEQNATVAGVHIISAINGVSVGAGNAGISIIGGSIVISTGTGVYVDGTRVYLDGINFTNPGAGFSVYFNNTGNLLGTCTGTVTTIGVSSTTARQESGTWTPIISVDGLEVTTFTATSALGTYTKIGREVTAICQYTYSGIGSVSSSFAFMTGMPYARSSDGVAPITFCMIEQSGFDTKTYSAIFLASGVIAFMYNNAIGPVYVNGASYMTGLDFPSSGTVRFVLKYLTD